MCVGGYVCAFGGGGVFSLNLGRARTCALLTRRPIITIRTMSWVEGHRQLRGTMEGHNVDPFGQLINACIRQRWLKTTCL